MLSQKQLFLKHIAQTSDNPMLLEIERAKGVYMYGPNGKEYIDLISGISVCNLGHSHPAIVETVKTQAEKYMHLMVYGEFVQSPQVRFAETLTNMLPDNFENVYIVNSGSEATEGALKLAKRYTGRKKIISYKDAYHGSTHGALSIIGREEYKRPYRPLLPEVYSIEFNNFDDLTEIDTDTACVIIEPIQGEAGVVIPENDYLRVLRKRCDEVGALLIFDEVQTGFGRTGKMFAFEHFGVLPDIINFAKGIGGGMPIGAFASSQEIMSVFMNNPVLGHITTFGGHPVSCAAANALLKELNNNPQLITDAPRKGELFKSLLQHEMIESIHGIGLFLAITLKDSAKIFDVIFEAMNKGVILDPFLFKEDGIRISAPLIINDNQIKEACSRILRTLDSVMGK